LSTTTTELGKRAEQLATDYLREHHYTILDRNYRIRQGEIDIIALQGEILCFVEVRSRRNAYYGHPLETVNLRKQRRLIRAAEHYLYCRGWEGAVRFDVVAIVYEPTLEIVCVKNAFEGSG